MAQRSPRAQIHVWKNKMSQGQDKPHKKVSVQGLSEPEVSHA